MMKSLRDLACCIAEFLRNGSICELVYLNMLVEAPSATAQGTWEVVASPDGTFGGSFWNLGGGGPADGDNFEVQFECSAGIYTLFAQMVLGPIEAIVDFDIDGVEVGSVDNYRVGTTQQNINEISGVVLTDGQHTLRVRVDGRNVASTGFRVRTTLFILRKDADA